MISEFFRAFTTLQLDAQFCIGVSIGIMGTIVALWFIRGIKKWMTKSEDDNSWDKLEYGWDVFKTRLGCTVKLKVGEFTERELESVKFSEKAINKAKRKLVKEYELSQKTSRKAMTREEIEAAKRKAEKKKEKEQEEVRTYNLRLHCGNCWEFSKARVPLGEKNRDYMVRQFGKIACPHCECTVPLKLTCGSANDKEKYVIEVKS